MIRLLRTFSLGLLAAVLAPYAALAATASLVRDIQAVDTSTYPLFEFGVQAPILSIGDRALFAAFESTSSKELWTSDGRTEGTSLVSDICPGNCPSLLYFVARVGRVGIFLATKDPSAARSTELWRSDGTAEGTFPLVDSEEVGPCGDPTRSVTLGGFAYFSLSTLHTGCALWRSDGTVAGTGMVKDFSPGSGDPNSLVVLGGRLYFFAFGPGRQPGLWRSDGTTAGTVPIRVFPNERFDPSALTVAGSSLFFIAGENGTGRRLWRSDGTPAGTRQVGDIPVHGTSLKLLDGLVYFVGSDGQAGTDLWRTDGTAAGTLQVTDFPYKLPFTGGIGIAKAGGSLILAAYDDERGLRLWVSGGTPSTTRLLEGCPDGCPGLFGSELVQAGDRILFEGYTPETGIELWSTDGTGVGTQLLRDVCSGKCGSRAAPLRPALGRWMFLARSRQGFGVWITDGTSAGTMLLASMGPRPFEANESFAPVEIGRKVLFTGAAGGRPRQLWESDGTPEGTRPVTLIGVSGPGSYPRDLAAVGKSLLFTACDGEDRALWRSGGTEDTTLDLTAGALSCSAPDSIRHLTVAGGLTYFLRGDSGSDRLWRTDGTNAGTFPISPSGSVSAGIPTPFGRKVVFPASGATGGSMLWESDGTANGTRKLVDLPGAARELIAAGPDLYFVVKVGSDPSDEQIWRSDGTAAGTRQITFFNGVYPFQTPPEMTPVGKIVFFVAASIAEVPDFANVLMKTDGTWEGTASLAGADGKPFVGTSNLVAHHGALYFFAATHDEPRRIGLWRTDGTPAGTALLARVGPRFTSEGWSPAWLTAVGDRLFFVAEDGEHGVELWKTDGTAAGTALVRDIVPEDASSNPSSLVAAGGLLFFTADDGVHGSELWQSDGTAAGTRMVQDIAPGGLSGRPQELTLAGDLLYFRADDSLHGPELWAYPLAGPQACQASETTLCLGGGRFRAEATWRDFQGRSGRGHAVSLTGDTGYFWFFDAANVEVVLKVLDGRDLNGHHWAFYGALSNVEYSLTITDVQTGAVRRYVNPAGRLGSVGDTNAFGPKGATGSAAPSLGPGAAMYEPVVSVRRTAAAAPCAPSSTRLCLSGGRFAVDARWRDFQGNTGTGKAVPLSGDTGYFWFFNEANVEVVLKVLDGRGVNGRHWVFYGALSSVEYELTVTDTETGVMRTYTNPSGRLASVADTGAF